MLYHSTRNKEFIVDSAQAVLSGLAPDGGLYVPSALPALDIEACLKADRHQGSHTNSYLWSKLYSSNKLSIYILWAARERLKKKKKQKTS